MHIVLTAKSDELASGLISKIINRLSSDAKWQYRTFSASEEYIYSDTADNFISPDRPSLLFVLEQEKDTVMFFPAGFRDARKADFVLCCAHIGSLMELLLSNFYDDFIR
ncbi:MAG: hypothetical protein K2H95_05295, partial [Bacteroidales bacterium]|nr:hypothetical protein [Bacteroidales bacterium]